jgi:hypothetical protein
VGRAAAGGRGYVVHAQPLPEPLPADAAARGVGGGHQPRDGIVIRQCPQQYLWGYHRYKAPRARRGRLLSKGPTVGPLASCWRWCGCCTGCRWALQAALGRGLGALLHTAGRARRRIALRNLELCLPEKTPAERQAWRARALRLARPQPARAWPALVRQPRRG